MSGESGESGGTGTAWLTDTTYGPQHAEYASLRHPGTLNWLLESPEYQTWRQRPQQTLFFSGEPGAGKSVAASVVVQDLEARLHRKSSSSEEPGAGIAYVYFDSLRQEEQGYEDIVLSVVQQLARSRPASERPSSPSWHSRSSRKSQPDKASISRYLDQNVTGYSAVFVVLDSLDECLEPCRTTLLSALCDVQSKHELLNLLVTTSQTGCAQLGDMAGQFANTTTVEISAHEQDLRLYLADNIPSSCSPSVSDDRDEPSHYIPKILQAARGRFLFAKLCVELTLVGGPASGTFDTATTVIPPAVVGPVDSSYDEIYGRIMEQIFKQTSQRAGLARRILPWLTHATRPLSVAELQHALLCPNSKGSSEACVEGDPIDAVSMVESCCGLARLVCINGATGVRLLHQTARDYLRRRLQGAEHDVGRRCVAYLSSRSQGGSCKTDEELTERLRLSPLFGYAAQNWGIHIRSIATPLQDEVIRNFLADRAARESAVQAAEAVMMRGREPRRGYSQTFVKNLTAMHFAVCAGAANVVAALLGQDDSHAMINARDGSGRTPLWYAARAGDSDVVELLLKDGLVDVDARDHKGRTPLSLAAENGHAIVAQRLLERGADPNLQDLERASPLWYATERGHASVVRALLENGRLRNVNQKPIIEQYTSDTPLSIALQRGDREVAELLARADGVDAHVRIRLDRSWTTPLGLAIREGYEDIALDLLKRFDTGQGSHELLVLAAAVGSTRLVATLLEEHGLDVNTTYPYTGEYGLEGQTPLMAAADQGHVAVVRLLLEAPTIQPDMKRSGGGLTALSHAAKAGFRDVVKILIADTRIDADHRDYEGRTPLSLAAENAREGVVEELLLAVGKVDPDCRDNAERTPLSRAVDSEYGRGPGGWRSFEGVVRRLLASGRVDPNSKSKGGKTPLAYAAENGALGLVEAILEHPDAEPDCGDERKPLALAAGEGHRDVVEALLKTGRVDVNAAGSDYEDTALSLAVHGGHEAVVDLLLSTPEIQSNKTDGYWATLLACAAREGRTAILGKLLAVDGVNPNSRDSQGRTPLSSAIAGWSNTEHVLKALLAVEGVDPDATDLKGRTALSLAAEAGRTELVDILLAAGANADMRDSAGRSPLSWVIGLDGWRGEYEKTDRRKDVARRLLQVPSVDPNAEDDEGLTPLIRAIQDEHGSEFVELLLTREDLDVHRKARDGRSPMEIARERGATAIISLLRARDALTEANPVPGNRDSYSDLTNEGCDHAGTAEKADVEMLPTRGRATIPPTRRQRRQSKSSRDSTRSPRR